MTFGYDPIVVPSDYNCDTCLLSINMQLEMFIIKILAPSDCDESIGNTQKDKDTLKLFASSKPDRIDTSYILNTQTKKLEQVFIEIFSRDPGPSHCMSIYTYWLTGLSDKPFVITYNDKVLHECHFKNEMFLIYNGDAINYSDKFGLKQGAWIEFFPNGNTKSKYNYLNGRLAGGFDFNINGDTINYYMSEF